jgi:hypothetical protein
VGGEVKKFITKLFSDIGIKWVPVTTYFPDPYRSPEKYKMLLAWGCINLWETKGVKIQKDLIPECGRPKRRITASGIATSVVRE